MTKLPATLAAMTAGDLSYWQAHNLAHAVVGLTDEQVTLVEAKVLAHASEQSISD
jgi:hypothetical protein